MVTVSSSAVEKSNCLSAELNKIKTKLDSSYNAPNTSVKIEWWNEIYTLFTCCKDCDGLIPPKEYSGYFSKYVAVDFAHFKELARLAEQDKKFSEFIVSAFGNITSMKTLYTLDTLMKGHCGPSKITYIGNIKTMKFDSYIDELCDRIHRAVQGSLNQSFLIKFKY